MPNSEQFVLVPRTPIPPDLVQRLAVLGQRQHFKNESVIIQRGDHAKGFWVIESGAVKLARLDVDGKIMLFDIAEPGRVFGELAYFHNVPRQVDAFAQGSTTLIWLADKHIRKLLTSEPDFAMLLLQSLAGQLHLALNRYIATRLNSSLGRLAQFLHDNATVAGHVMRLTQQDLADAVDVSRNTANALVLELVQAGVIEKGYGWLKVTDMDGLKQLAR